MRWLVPALFLGCVLVLGGAAPATAHDGGQVVRAETCVTLGDGRDPTSCDDGGGDGGAVAGIVVVFLLIGVGITVVRVSMARSMARKSGMDEGDATAVTLLDDNGLSATYVASNLRPTAGVSPTASPRPVAERLAELESLHAQGLVTKAEYDERRAAILGSL